MPDLLPMTLPRRPRRRMAHVADAGSSMIQFRCLCGWDSGWMRWELDGHTVAEAKRGYPCPDCNKETGNG